MGGWGLGCKNSQQNIGMKLNSANAAYTVAQEEPPLKLWPLVHLSVRSGEGGRGRGYYGDVIGTTCRGAIGGGGGVG